VVAVTVVVIASTTQQRRGCVVEALDTLLAFLATAPNLEHLALLNAVPCTFECASRALVSLPRLMELGVMRTDQCNYDIG